MGRKDTQTWRMIHSLCEIQEIREDDLYAKARLLLGIYRKVCWSTIGRADCIAGEMVCYCGSGLDGALIYLEEFAPESEKDRFERRIKTLFESRWMVQLIESAMLRVREFPDYGGQYFEIISKCYLTRYKYTESEMLELLNMERSRFYDRKKEAIMVFGLALWGNAIPQLRTYLEESDDEGLSAVEYCVSPT